MIYVNVTLRRFGTIMFSKFCDFVKLPVFFCVTFGEMLLDDSEMDETFGESVLGGKIIFRAVVTIFGVTITGIFVGIFFGTTMLSKFCGIIAVKFTRTFCVTFGEILFIDSVVEETFGDSFLSGKIFFLAAVLITIFDVIITGIFGAIFFDVVRFTTVGALFVGITMLGTFCGFDAVDIFCVTFGEILLKDSGITDFFGDSFSIDVIILDAVVLITTFGVLINAGIIGNTIFGIVEFTKFFCFTTGNVGTLFLGTIIFSVTFGEISLDATEDVSDIFGDSTFFDDVEMTETFLCVAGLVSFLSLTGLVGLGPLSFAAKRLNSERSLCLSTPTCIPCVLRVGNEKLGIVDDVICLITP